MTSFGARFTRQLPDWARRTHPALRYELGGTARLPARARYLRALGVVLAGLALLLVGVLIATGLLTQTPGATPLDAAFRVLYYPALALQLILMAAAFSLTLGKVAREQRRRNWDNFRATPDGADLTLRARWAAVFYRLRGLLGLVLAVRVLLLLGVLWDLTAFQGRYLDLLISGVTPQMGLIPAVLLLALTMTAALLLPVTSVGVCAALGLLAATTIRGRTWLGVVQIVGLLLRIGAALLLLWGASELLGGRLVLPDTAAWLLIAAAAALGDWGLMLLSLTLYADLWAKVPYGILIGAALVGWALIQAALADRLLHWAVRRAQQPE